MGDTDGKRDGGKVSESGGPRSPKRDSGMDLPGLSDPSNSCPECEPSLKSVESPPILNFGRFYLKLV